MPGRAYLINGDVYYSPNSDRNVQLPSELNIDNITLFNNVGVEAFEKPYWWSERVPWLGFVPRRPVCWNGALVEDLGYMPRRLLVNTERTAYMLPYLSQNRWLAVENLIREVLQLLSRRYNIQYLEPYSTRKWGYTNGHPTEAQMWSFVHQGRDWFAMWIALLYWMLKIIPEDLKYIEGVCPTEWYRVLVKWDKARIGAWESLRCAPLLQRFWDAQRSGVFLHNPEDQLNQPSASWFDHCGVPVWYRWGSREVAQSQRNDFRLIVPPPEIVQIIATLISPSITSYATGAGHEWEDTHNYEPHFTPASPPPAEPQFMPASPRPAEPQFMPASPPPTQLIDDQVPSSSPSQASKLIWKNGGFRTIEKSGRDVWEPFHRRHQERHQKMLLHETPLARQTRLNREKQPPFVSAAVYVWEWNLEMPPKFVRRLVPKKDRSETLEDARPGEARYDSFCNEWTVCTEWMDESDDESDGEADEENGKELQQDEGGVNSPARVPSTQVVIPEPSTSTTPSVPSVAPGHVLVPSPSGELEKSQQEVLHVLTKYYGFSPPQGLPTDVGPLARLADIKALIAITGTTTVKINSALWGTPMGKACVEFGLFLANKEGLEPPAAAWDLSQNCQDPLKFSLRLRRIKRVRAGSLRLYMFDFGELATLSWNIAVYTATAALMVCRLHPNLTDEDIAVELARSGVPFRTLRK
ncbi:hypothetical protein Agabi119p4_9913 [Agaricus bisporus var. burnettii]|uniref:Uncharacterized protein n=1 Tax=Agaricus bisporus var. burnettii TaxID=192524 RepID=A0A8H7EX97_AGABI|nr:hypothetical protein Agabi119p4_9913 [Agaricus bisporus var. burnettii]